MEGVSGDLNADCDGAVSRQLLTITLMEELQCKGEMARQISPSQFVSVCNGPPPLLSILPSFLPSVKAEMYQQRPDTAD